MELGKRELWIKIKKIDIQGAQVIRILGICVMLLGLLCACVQSAGIVKKAKKTDLIVMSEDESFCYHTAKVGKSSYIFQVNDVRKEIKSVKHTEKGDKHAKNDKVIDLFCYGDEVFCLTVSDGKKGQNYEITRYSSELECMDYVATTEFAEELRPSRIYISYDMLYLTMISSNQKKIIVYGMDIEDLRSGWYKVAEQPVNPYRYIKKAVYDGMTLQVAYDNGDHMYISGEEEKRLTSDRDYFDMRERLIQSKQIRHMSLWSICKLIWLRCLIIIVITIATYFLIHKSYALWCKTAGMRRLLVQVMGITSILILLVVISINGIEMKLKQNDAQKNISNTLIAFEQSFGNTYGNILHAKDSLDFAQYHEAYGEMLKLQQYVSDLSEILLVYESLDSRQMIMSTNESREKAQELYVEEGVHSLVKQAQKSAKLQHDIVKIDGKKYAIYVIPVKNEMLVDEFIVALVDRNTMDQSIRRDWIIGISIWVLFTMLFGVTLWSFSRKIFKS